MFGRRADSLTKLIIGLLNIVGGSDNTNVPWIDLIISPD